MCEGAVCEGEGTAGGLDLGEFGFVRCFVCYRERIGRRAGPSQRGSGGGDVRRIGQHWCRAGDSGGEGADIALIAYLVVVAVAHNLDLVGGLSSKASELCAFCGGIGRDSLPFASGFNITDNDVINVKVIVTSCGSVLNRDILGASRNRLMERLPTLGCLVVFTKGKTGHIIVGTRITHLERFCVCI